MTGPRERLDDLHRRQAQSEQGGGEKRIAQQHAKGKLTARERVEHLLDLVDGVAFDAGDKPDIRQAQLIKPIVICEAQVKKQQDTLRQVGCCPFPEHLIMRLAIFFVPDLAGQQRSHTPRSLTLRNVWAFSSG